MTSDTNFILGIFLGIAICAFCFLLFRDIIIRKLLSLFMPTTTGQMEDLRDLQQAVKHDIGVDIQILLDNKKTVETILNLQVELSDQDKESLETILELLNKRVSQAEQNGWVIKDNNLEED